MVPGTLGALLIEKTLLEASFASQKPVYFFEIISQVDFVEHERVVDFSLPGSIIYDI